MNARPIRLRLKKKKFIYKSNNGFSKKKKKVQKWKMVDNYVTYKKEKEKGTNIKGNAYKNIKSVCIILISPWLQ